eukprot:scaffold92797_cov23-Tisochrysis_lutea.AAC.3
MSGQAVRCQYVLGTCRCLRAAQDPLFATCPACTRNLRLPNNDGSKNKWKELTEYPKAAPKLAQNYPSYSVVLMTWDGLGGFNLYSFTLWGYAPKSCKL